MAWKPDYVSLTELKAYRKTDVGFTEDDTEYAFAITASSRAVDRATRRQFGLTASEPRVYGVQWDRESKRWYASTDDTFTVAPTVALDPSGDESFTEAVTEFTMWPRNAGYEDKPYTQIWFPSGTAPRVVNGEALVKVTAAWGWTTVPVTIKQATLIQSSRFKVRQDSPFGVAGSPENGNEMRLLAKLDPDVQLMVRPYYRMWGVR